jgi:hypothetical protein
MASIKFFKVMKDNYTNQTGFIGIQTSSSDAGSSFLYFPPNISKCGLLSRI